MNRVDGRRTGWSHKEYAVPKLNRGLILLFEFLKTKRADDLVSRSEIMAATGWKESTLATYLRKNKLTKLLATTVDGDEFRVLVDGHALRAEDVAGALTQVTERPVPLTKNDRVVGQHDEYVLVSPRGDGAVGQVWEARAVRTGSLVAVKICSPRPDLLEPTILANVRDRFRREYRFGPRVAHPFLVQYRDWGEYDDAPFLVMELADETLRDVLNARTRLTLADALGVMKPLVDALAHLHAQNCVHRDVKPANVLRTARGFVLGDFGIVQWGDLSKAFTSAGTITRASVQLGSWFYMAPEQLESPHHANPASDVYALGITLIEMLTGDAPAPQRVAARRVPPPSGVPAIDGLIFRMTEYSPEARPTLPEIAETIASVLLEMEGLAAQSGR